MADKPIGKDATGYEILTDAIQGGCTKWQK